MGKRRFYFWPVALWLSAPVFGASPASIEDQLREILSVHVLAPTARHPVEQFKFANGTLKVVTMRNRPQESLDRTACSLYQLLFYGRSNIGRGVKEAFNRVRELQSISVSMVERVRSDQPLPRPKKSGLIRYQSEEKVVEVMRVRIDRSTMGKKRYPRRADLFGEIGRCVEAGAKASTEARLTKDLR